MRSGGAGGAETLDFALDDIPTKRHGPYVLGACIDHKPSPGTASSPSVHGHVSVVTALLVPHPAWGTVALPLLARPSVRGEDLPVIDPKHRPAFLTRLQLAVELLRRSRPWLGHPVLPTWAVADGADAGKESLEPATGLGRTVVSRLRDDMDLWGVPGPQPPGRRGRHRPTARTRSSRPRGLAGGEAALPRRPTCAGSPRSKTSGRS